jgi:hypothetical protein
MLQSILQLTTAFLDNLVLNFIAFDPPGDSKLNGLGRR